MVQPWDYIHMPGSSGLTVESFLSRTEHGTASVASGPNALLAQPWFTGDIDMAIASLGVRVTATGTGNVDLAIYEAISERDVYPGNRVWQSPLAIPYSATGAILRTVAQSFTAGKLYWLVTNADGGSGSHVVAFAGQALTFPAGVLGWLTTDQRGANMLRVARNYADGMPAVFPAGAVPVAGPLSAQQSAPAIIVVPTQPPPPPPVVGGLATGGTVNEIVDGGYTWRVHTFTADDDFVVTQPIAYAQYLLIGGGGGGGASQSVSSWASGGGGGGGRRRERLGGLAVAAGTFPVVVGVGGAGGLPNTATGTAGNPSTWNGFSASGGSPGGSYPSHAGGASIFNGGSGAGSPAYGAGGGGGGGAVGANGTSAAGGAGGAGYSSSITGASVAYGGGGGGGIYSGVLNGAGGTGGGGAGGVGGVANANGSDGTNGLGGGGGGASTTSGSKAGATSTGGRGGDGVVIIRYPIA